MTENKTTDESANTFTQEDMDRANSYKSNMATQLSDLRKQNDEFATALKERDAADEKAKTAKMEEDGKLKELNDTLTLSIETMKTGHQSELSKLQTEIKDYKTLAAIKGAGINDEFQALGVKSRYDATVDAPEIGDWLTTLKESTPALFVEVSANLENHAAGSKTPASAKLTDALADEYAKSGDPVKQEQAEDYWDEKLSS